MVSSYDQDRRESSILTGGSMPTAVGRILSETVGRRFWHVMRATIARSIGTAVPVR